MNQTTPDYERTQPRRISWLVMAQAGCIVIGTILAYLPALRAGFIWDDDQHVTDNVLLRSAAGLKLIWTKPGATPQYYPLTHTTFWIEQQLWGNNPTAYHLVNVLLHTASALILWRILSLLKLRAAWLAAAIFALHPIEVESVAWITERKNVLAGLFYFGAMLSYLTGWRFASMALFAAAILSKTIAGTLPAALLLILWWKDGRIRIKDVLYVLPMFAMALAMGSMTAWMERTHVGAAGEEWEFSIVERILIAGRAVWFYAYKIILPYKLTFVYARWEIDARSVVQWLFPIGVVVVIGALLLNRKRLGRGPLACVLYFTGTLVPALGFANIYPMRYSFVADHFQYLAGVGLIVLIAETLSRIVHARVLMVLPMLLGVLTFLQAHMYYDSRTLWETTLARNPDAWIAHDHMGAIIGTTDVDAAIKHYTAAQQLNPKDMDAHIGMGRLLIRIDRKDEGIEQLRKAVAARPDHPRPWYALGVELDSIGDGHGAVVSFENALRVDPKFVPARLKLADLYTRLGRGDDAARERAEAQRQMSEMLGR